MQFKNKWSEQNSFKLYAHQKLESLFHGKHKALQSSKAKAIHLGCDK